MRRPSTNTSHAVMTPILPNSMALEAYRSLRFNIECSVFGRDAKTISITSSSRGEGKTTTAVHLAVAYAQIGKKVLLLDADLRNPSIHFVFDMENRRGLTNYLEGQATRHEIVRETIVDHLSFISGGPLTQNPSGLLASQRMDTLLAELSEEYDVIIVDTPSLLTISDAKIMATKCDGVLLIIEHGQLKRNVAKKVKEELALANAKLIGVVLNEVTNHPANAYL
ncbi:CpsD/CapB family tyrosine-protein kinase [Paenibacillus roseipurpureus]|uniref:non-specific protein-tyrosine kinase n=1 Tax=Paenibacillus roseopurpureus TaxID=2918901 RepID=A0AA96RK04_9BACL|nr:CpsD/CapB family tyrosine-protein kinase [Paenibacillus sp. MBLB1832]WNR43819.1 CpsD/CapB family tyrosine-protein kinase [Paenibacillus sp. MBLB1832]